MIFCLFLYYLTKFYGLKHIFNSMLFSTGKISAQKENKQKPHMMGKFQVNLDELSYL